MRQIFSSQRVETVEGVAELLEKNGIDTYISNGRSYQGKRGSQFSYSEPLAKVKQPAVWVRHADDQPKAREILREHGLLDSTRPDQPRLLDLGNPDEATDKRRWALRIRLVLLSLIVAAAAFTFLRHRALRDEAKHAVPPPVPAQQVAPPDTGLKDDEERIRIPALSPPPQAAPQR
jgi:hypothetical protein